VLSIYIVTPCCRPENLPLLNDGVERARRRVPVRWIVAFDGSKVPEDIDLSQLTIDESVWFHPKDLGETAGGAFVRNAAIAKVPEGDAWVIMLDDDNLLSQEVVDAAASADDDTDWIIPSRVMPSGQVEPPPFVPEVGNIDTAQLVARKRVLGDSPFRIGYCADGVLAAEMERRGVSIWRRPDLSVTYNALDAVKTWERVPGWLNVPSMYLRVIEEIPKNGKLVEVGIYGGKSSFLMMERMKELKKPIEYHVVDFWDDVVIRQAWVAASRWYRPFFSELWMTSTRAAERFEDASLDAVIIDANHNYEFVRDDLAAWVPKVKAGGIVAGDDYRNASWPGVERAVNEALGTVEFIPPMGFFWRKP